MEFAITLKSMLVDAIRLRSLLVGNRFASYLEIEPHGLQLSSFMAVVYDLKPAMDMWIGAARWPAFLSLVKQFNLKFYLDCVFDRAQVQNYFYLTTNLNTTKAVYSPCLTGINEAHVFIAKDEHRLSEVTAAGWYPLVINHRIVGKHPADHLKFGKTLGYPPCCRAFFREHNNWHYYNTLYMAFASSPVANYRVNSLLRHTAYSFIPHMACSFDCEDSISYARILEKRVKTENPRYGNEIERLLRTPFLCLSEIKIYRFEGKQISKNEVHYNFVEPVTPTSPEDPVYYLLLKGNRCVLEGNIVRVFKEEEEVSVYYCRGDQLGPEIPFVVHCYDD